MQPTPVEPAPKTKRNMVLIILVAIAALSIPCIGCVAAIAIPAFVNYVKRSKAVEAESHLEQLYVGAQAYYEREFPSPSGELLTRCVVDAAATPNEPSSQKSMLDVLPPSFDALGFHPADPVYYQYEIVSSGGCNHAPGEQLYVLLAHGDLDGDGVRSRYEITVRSSALGADRTALTSVEPLE